MPFQGDTPKTPSAGFPDIQLSPLPTHTFIAGFENSAQRPSSQRCTIVPL